MSKKEEQPKPPTEPNRMTAAEKAEFFELFMNGRVFTDRHIIGIGHELTMISAVFMPVGLGAIQMTDEYVKNVGIIWEDLEKQQGGVNGLPSFFSCNIMHKEDWDELRPKVKAETERMQKVAAEIAGG